MADFHDIRLKRDTFANFTSYNPIIKEGQNCLEYKTERNAGSASMKVGNSDTSRYNDLPYVLGDKSDVDFNSELSETYQEIPDSETITHSDFFSRVRNSLAWFKANYHELSQENIDDDTKVPSSKVVYDGLAKKVDIEDAKKITMVTLTVDGWIGDTAPYQQTIQLVGVTSSMNPRVVPILSETATSDEADVYNSAMSIITAGSGYTTDGEVTFRVYEKPEIDVTFGLMDLY